MAIDFGTSNTTRYYSVPDHADFTLPNSDWAWLALVRPQTPGTISNYAISTGDWGVGNSFNLYTYGTTSGAAVKVDGLVEVQVSENALALNTWHWIFAVRSSGVLNCGQIALNASATTEAGGITISAAYDATTGPQIGRRAAGLIRNWNGQISQAAFISGSSVTDAQLVELASGAPLLSMPFAPSIKFLFHGKNADATIADLIAGKVATKQGTSYGTSEEDAQTPYIWVPEYTRGVAAASGYTIAANPGAIAITGTAASLESGKLLSAGSASFAVSGAAASLNHGYSLPAQSGSVQVTGTSATLKYGRVLPCSAGSIQVSGSTASLESGRLLSGGSGSFQISGTDATLTYTPAGNFTLVANPGTFQIGGSVASLEYGRRIQADTGSFAFTGTAATLRYAHQVIAEAGQFAITGTAAGLTIGNRAISASRTYNVPVENRIYLIPAENRTHTVKL